MKFGICILVTCLPAIAVFIFLLIFSPHWAYEQPFFILFQLALLFQFSVFGMPIVVGKLSLHNSVTARRTIYLFPAVLPDRCQSCLYTGVGQTRSFIIRPSTKHYVLQPSIILSQYNAHNTCIISVALLFQDVQDFSNEAYTGIVFTHAKPKESKRADVRSTRRTETSAGPAV